MPHSVLTGRPAPAPGEPLFTEEDTAGALALAEEERDTCPSCGYPKAWCRDPRNQFGAFDVAQEFCWATYRLADYRKAKVDNMSESQRASVQLAVRFREGREPDFDAGLGLGDEPDVHDYQGEERDGGHEPDGNDGDLSKRL